MFKIDYTRISRYESALISRIIDRVMDLCDDRNHPLRNTERLTLEMCLYAVHLDVPLELHRLLEAPAQDLFHDVFGISRHLDRQTGKLTGCFLPRCAMNSTEISHER